MIFAHRLWSGVWVSVPLCALVFLLWMDFRRAQRVEALSALSGWAVDAPTPDATSLTGYAGGGRTLIVPERNFASQEWIMQAQQMLAQGDGRVQRVDYDNAPVGRETYAAAPYRWWLVGLAWLDHFVSGRPLGRAVERAALWADPLMHGLLLAGLWLWTARRFGLESAAVLVVALATLFPLGGAFLPGAPNDMGLACACVLGSVLLLLEGLQEGSAAGAQRRFFLSGAVGGFGLWVNAASVAPVLVGIALAAVAAAWLVRRRRAAFAVPPWRAWGLGGALVSLVGYGVENLPDRLGWRLEVNHPLYAFAWLGSAELLARAVRWIRDGKPGWQKRDVGAVLIALVAIAAVPIAWYCLQTRGVLVGTPGALRLTGLFDFTAPNLGAWLVQRGSAPLFAATCLPLLLLVPLAWFLFRRETAPDTRAGIAVLAGPLLVAVGFAWQRLSWWNGVDTLLAALLVVAVAGTAPRWRGAWLVALLAVATPGVIALLPQRSARIEQALTEKEVEALAERDLAQWLARRTGPGEAVVFAPPSLMAALAYHGGLRGLVGNIIWENQDGLTALVRIASATTTDEAQTLLEGREISFLVVPDGDRELDELARLGSSQTGGTFIQGLNQWAVPFWLRPVAYPRPDVAGLDRRAPLVLEVVEEQEPTLALSRVAEYLVETGRSDLAAGTRVRLRRYPKNLGVLVALARVEASLGQQEAFEQVFAGLLGELMAQDEKALPWDRRVSLAMILARGDRFDLARTQVERCLAGVDEARLRTLPATPLFHLQMLAKRFGLAIADPQLRQLAVDLLPPGAMRERLAR